MAFQVPTRWSELDSIINHQIRYTTKNKIIKKILYIYKGVTLKFNNTDSVTQHSFTGEAKGME